MHCILGVRILNHTKRSEHLRSNRMLYTIFHSYPFVFIPILYFNVAYFNLLNLGMEHEIYRQYGIKHTDVRDK